MDCRRLVTNSSNFQRLRKILHTCWVGHLPLGPLVPPPLAPPLYSLPLFQANKHLLHRLGLMKNFQNYTGILDTTVRSLNNYNDKIISYFSTRTSPIHALLLVYLVIVTILHIHD